MTKNEEANLPKCLASVTRFDEVFVVHRRPFPLDESWSDDEACRRIAEEIEEANREARRLAGKEDAPLSAS